MGGGTKIQNYGSGRHTMRIICLGMSTFSPETVSSPEVLSASRGSSVTTGLREEYEDLLCYAVVTPVVNTHVGGIPLATANSGGPPPRTSPPPRPYTPPRHVTRTGRKVKGNNIAEAS